jgi:hypothetical protein
VVGMATVLEEGPLLAQEQELGLPVLALLQS